MSSTVLANVTAVAIGGRALLIEGAPGSGKSSLALALIDRGAVLIGDDAVEIASEDGHPWAAPPPGTAGMLHVNNVGIVDLSTSSAPVALVLTLDAAAPHFPLDSLSRAVGGIEIPRLTFAPGDAAQALRAEYALKVHGVGIPNSPDGAHNAKA